jgi:hypothetical protein
VVDFSKRARNTNEIEPDEEVIAACNVTPSPFGVANAGMTGGLIAGGVVGMAVGAAWDARRKKQSDAAADQKMLPAVAARLPYEPGIPTNGALLAVTTKRVLAWRISGLGKVREKLIDFRLDDIDEVWWEDADAKWMAGQPGSLLMWIGIGDKVLSLAGIAMGPAGKHIRKVVSGFEDRLGAKVQPFEG